MSQDHGTEVAGECTDNPEPSAPETVDEGRLWSFLRDVLSQGMAIEKDMQNGAYPSYEHFSAHIDEVARKRAAEFAERTGKKASGERRGD
jgi:hypothetical protein